MHEGHLTTWPLRDEAATLALGKAVARALVPGLVIHLEGGLGAGKTTLVRGVLTGLGYRGKVKSPTYTLSELYAISSFSIYHFDLYRFSGAGEWEEAGFRDLCGPQTVCFVEWPERAAGLVPGADVAIRLEMAGDGRTAYLDARTEEGRQCVNRIRP
jgi:tRNA threonylcarbamoyladenosine biosynthesis protein TsaE